MIKMINRKLFVVGKIILSGIISFVILSLFCYFYFNIPVPCVNHDGSTDYKWESNVFYSRWTEGFAWGKTNNEGFINMFDYTKNMQIDILIMGSSHMEAYQVGMNESTASRLNSLLENDIVYNIGISAHTFLACVSNLDAAIEKYQPTKYVIIETNTLSFSEDALIQAVHGSTDEIPLHAGAGGYIDLLMQNPFFRLAGSQVKDFMKKSKDITDKKENVTTIVNADIEQKIYNS